MDSEKSTLTVSETRTIETKIEVKLLGQKLVLKSADLNAERFQEIIHLAGKKLDLAQARAKNAPPHQVALLALLDLAEEYVAAKKRTQDYQTEMHEKSDELRRLIEAEFK
ncbi:MAG: cell division protein ZapA [Bdellovibrio sp.]|nr:cell division protein ZapA [Bdellovibrio sp.]